MSNSKLTTWRECHNWIHDEEEVGRARDVFMDSKEEEACFGISLVYRKTKVPDNQRVTTEPHLSKSYLVDCKTPLSQQICQYFNTPVEFTFTSPIPTDQLAIYLHTSQCTRPLSTLQQIESGVQVSLQLLRSMLAGKPILPTDLKMCSRVSAVDRQPCKWFHFEVDEKPFARMEEVCQLVPGPLFVIETKQGYHFLFPKTTLSAHISLYKHLDQHFFKPKICTLLKSNQIPLPGTFQRGHPVNFHVFRP